MASLGNPVSKQLEWTVFGCCAVAVVVASIGSSRILSSAVGSLHAAEADVASPAPASGAPRAQTSSARRDGLVDGLPPDQDSDALTRYLSKIAHEEGLALLQMQSENLKTDPRHLAQRRSTLEVRGDYLSTKRMLIAMLAKFPGLTLEHWAIRHRPSGAATNAPADAANRPDDESTIELIQYSRPSQASS